MAISIILKVMMTLAFAVTLCQGQGQSQDATLAPGAFGTNVVNSVIARIRSKCIFSEDRLFLRRAAYVMSRDGRDSRTYRPGFNGGIWQVTESMFRATQNCRLSSLSSACNNITSKLVINWGNVNWSDLRKPLYSGLAAAMSALLSLGSRSMPGDVASQATTWASMYGENSGATYITDANRVPNFQCKDKLDLVFILDSSGSVSGPDFVLMKNFTAQVAEKMNVSLDGVRIADVIYASSVRVEFNFTTYSTKSEVKSSLLNAKKIGGGTNTAGGLAKARELFNPQYGDRSDAKNVAVLVTDGRSNSYTRTVDEAKKLKDVGVTVFAIGVGNYNLRELQAVASDPICSHVLTLTNFNQIDSIIDQIQKSACDANFKTTENTTVEGEIAENGSETTIETVGLGPNKTIEVNVTCGILHVYVSLSDPKPGSAVYDKLYVATPGHPATVTLVETAPQGVPVYITVVGTRLPSSLAQLRQCTDFKWTLTPTVKTNVTVICEENGVRRACTEQDLVKAGLCSNSDSNLPVENPCTTTNLGRGITRFPYPYSPYKFLQCDMQGNYYITLCPNGVTFNAQTRECGFTSPGSYPMENNGNGNGNGSQGVTQATVSPVTSAPVVGIASKCTTEALRKKQFYHTYDPDEKKFVQCDQWGNAYLMNCGPNTKWSQSHYTCIHDSPTTTPVCVDGRFYNRPCEPSKYDVCDHGLLVEHQCPHGLRFNLTITACDWPRKVPIPSTCP